MFKEQSFNRQEVPKTHVALNPSVNPVYQTYNQHLVDYILWRISPVNNFKFNKTFSHKTFINFLLHCQLNLAQLHRPHRMNIILAHVFVDSGEQPFQLHQLYHLVRRECRVAGLPNWVRFLSRYFLVNKTKSIVFLISYSWG